MAASTFLSDGTALYTYSQGVALAAGEDTVARGATAVLRATPAGDLVPMYDLQLQPITSVRTSEDLGVFPAFFAAIPAGVLDAGSVQLPIFSTEAVAAGLAAESRAASLASLVQQLIDSLGGYVTGEQLAEAVRVALADAGGGAAFSGTVTAEQISDSTELSQQVIQAATGEAVRLLIGAGTSSVKVGTDADDAKAGNWRDPDAMRRVAFGTDAATARPQGLGNGQVYWVGSGTVLPQNAMPADPVWLP